MTAVRFDYRVPANDTDAVAPAGGWVFCRPSRTIVADDLDHDPYVLAQDVAVALVDGVATINLKSSGTDWYWIITDPSGAQRTVGVPDSGATIDASALPDIDPATYEPTVEPSAAWSVALTSLENRVNILEDGGAGLPAGGTTGQTLIKNSASSGDASWAALTKAMVGLGNVDNTADSAKPVSTAQAAAISAAVNSLVSGAPGTLDTLAEIAAALGSDPNLATTITNALAARVRTDTAAQGLTGTQKANARANLDVAPTVYSAACVYRSGADWVDAAGTVITARPVPATQPVTFVGADSSDTLPAWKVTAIDLRMDVS